jgi:hypothetical protein
VKADLFFFFLKVYIFLSFGKLLKTCSFYPGYAFKKRGELLISYPFRDNWR